MEYQSTELNDAVRNFAAEWRLDTPLWSGRHVRPLPVIRSSWKVGHSWKLVFLANTVERIAANYVGEPDVRFRQAAVDMAMCARRGDLSTWARAEIGGSIIQQVNAIAWATWFRDDELPKIFRACTIFLQSVGNCWIYVDEDELDMCFPRAEPQVGPVASPDAANATVECRAGYRTTRAAEAEATCGAWIKGLTARPANKEAAWEDARAAITRLSRKAFDRAWAISAPAEWSGPGRRRKSTAT